MTPTTMRVSTRYGSHLPALMACVSHSAGPVLELGLGTFSTPYLHYVCQRDHRELLSLDNDGAYVEWARRYVSPCHQVQHVTDWDQAGIVYPWAVALVDHSPSDQRIVEIRRLACCARYIVIHDTHPKWERVYHYSTIWPLFKHRRDWPDDEPGATVVSNFVELDDLWP